MTLRELIDQFEIQGDGIIQTYDVKKEKVIILYEWEYDLNGCPENIRELYVHYMWANSNGKMVIEVNNERF